MTITQKYRTYLKDNPEGYWFKRKVWGWGWVPARWQGWAALGIFVVVFVWMLVPYLREPAPSSTDVSAFVIKVVIWAALLLLLCYLKGERPKWSWGFPKDYEKR